ncbi:RICIN domain-containing protein [Streptomyces sp. NBC_01198]|uniref:RICIN domain-containing protein n=1 Tax=Streptomyces sp. NBC_01198 TaxID=2903769 RepID=UPI002E147661|nr:RICIN domain-containing protein [Streptomyces sp. NBC_01198]
MRSKVNLGLAALSTAALLSIGLASASPASASSYPTLQNLDLATKMCATPLADGKTNGTIVTQWPCAEGERSQEWEVHDNDYGVLYTNVASGKCLVPSGSSTTKGTNLVLWTCDPHSEAEAWSGSNRDIWNVKSEMAITTKGGSVGKGAYLTQWPENGSVSQSWGWGIWN